MSVDVDASVRRAMRIAEFRAGLRTFLRRSEDVSRRNALTPQRFLVLLMIKGAPDGSEHLTFTALTERLKLGRNTVSEIVARCEAAGLVARERSAVDRRNVYLRLTPEGDRRLAAALDETDADRRDLARVFRALSSSFREASRA
jgi:DNA-binding MarR family transcriptional regulator